MIVFLIQNLKPLKPPPPVLRMETQQADVEAAVEEKLKAQELGKEDTKLELELEPVDLPEPMPGLDNKQWTKQCKEAGEWGTEKCGGWSQRDMRTVAGECCDIPADYKSAVDLFRAPPPAEKETPIPMEAKLAAREDGAGGIFCYGMVMNPPEETFDLVGTRRDACIAVSEW